MTIKDDLSAKVSEYARTSWGDIPNATVVPTDLTFGNDGRRMDVTFLYADISDSTKLVDASADTQAAEYYKAFLHCASQLVKRHGGEIQAYDGDRVMAVFIGDGQADSAVGAALELHYVVADIINPTMNAVYTQTPRTLRFTVGIDSGKCLVAKVGVRAVGELAWIGGAANYAAKLNSFDGLDHKFPIRITQQTFDKLSLYAKRGSQGEAMWEGPFNDLKARSHYRTSFYRSLP